MTSPLWNRLVEAQKVLSPVQPKYCVVYEDPDFPDEPARILNIDPNFNAAAKAGGYIPPIDAHLRDAQTEDGAKKEYPYAEPIGPMTDEQIVEYCILKDIPRRVWEYKGNRRVLVICRVEQLPRDRTFRNAWRIDQEVEMETENA